MRFSKDPDYYYNKRLRLEQKMSSQPIPVPVPVPVIVPPKPDVVIEKKKPGRKKKVPIVRNPIVREERTVVVRWD